MNFNRFIRFSNYQIQMIFLSTLIVVLIILYIKRRQNIAEFVREEERINKELYQKELLYQKRIKEFEKEKEKHQKQIEEYKRDLEKQKLQEG